MEDSVEAAFLDENHGVKLISLDILLLFSLLLSAHRSCVRCLVAYSKPIQFLQKIMAPLVEAPLHHSVFYINLNSWVSHNAKDLLPKNNQYRCRAWIVIG